MFLDINLLIYKLINKQNASISLNDFYTQFHGFISIESLYSLLLSWYNKYKGKTIL